MIAVGIDPGASGAVATISSKGKVRLYDTPNRKVDIAKRTVKDYDIDGCVTLLKKLSEKKCYITLEDPKAFYFSSKVANFSLGRSKGIWEGILSALGLQYQLVSPATWKKVMLEQHTKGWKISRGKQKAKVKRYNERIKKKGGKGVKKIDKKLESLKAAKRLFPLVEIDPKRHDQADALLLAEFGRRQDNGKV